MVTAMDNIQLEKLLNEKLSPQLIKDYAPNGLQVEGKKGIQKIVTGVTASQALINAAIEKKCRRHTCSPRVLLER